MSDEYDLKALRAAAEEACKKAVSQREAIGGAVNWADLHCYEARRYETDAGEIGYAVVIEEASPNSNGLSQFISDELHGKGFENVKVCLDW
jgi:hypothetical protein